MKPEKKPERKYLHGTLLVLLVGAALVLAACASSGDTAPSEPVVDTQTEAAPAGEGLTVTDVWAWSPVSDTAGVFMVVTNNGTEDDALIGGSSEGVGRVEVHETQMKDGIAEMVPIEELVIPAGETQELKPGAYHVMLKELEEPLEVGTTIPITLEFTSGPVEVEAEVRAFDSPM